MIETLLLLFTAENQCVNNLDIINTTTSGMGLPDILDFRIFLTGTVAYKGGPSGHASTPECALCALLWAQVQLSQTPKRSIH